MTLKGTSLLIALVFATSGGAAAAPLPHPDGLPNGRALTQQVRHRHYLRHWHGYWHNCPYWYEQNLLGEWRLFSPCSNRVNTHAF